MEANDKPRTVKEIVFYTLGLLLIAGFIYLYWTRFILSPEMPPAIQFLYFDLGRNWAILANAGVFVLFLVFLPYRDHLEWRSKGAFTAFILALFTEMFGVPLMLYILSPLLPDMRFSPIGQYLPLLLSMNPRYFGWLGGVLGTWMTLIGMLLVMVGWVQVHRAAGLVTTGLYQYVRHPQYLGLFLIITGWILAWATLLTLLMYPILLVIYYRLARREEKTLEQRFGSEYNAYRQKTSMFVPLHLGKSQTRRLDMATNKPSYARAVLNFLRSVAIVDLCILAVSALICWFIGALNRYGYGNALEWIGGISIAIGAMSFMSGLPLTGGFGYQYARSAGSDRVDDRTAQDVGERIKSYRFTFLMAVAGVVSIGLGMLVQAVL